MERRLFRTLDARLTDDSMIKPGELVDLVEMTPLTLADRRIYNQLIAHAWDGIDQSIEHVINKRELAGNHNGYDRVGESVERLMAAIVKVRILRDGKPAIERVQLLGSNTEYETSDGQLRYEFPAKLRRIIRESTIFARLRIEVMFALSSKYALALYEMVQKRGNLTTRTHEEFSLREFRDLLGISKGRLPVWGNLNQRAIAPAVREVGALSDYDVTVEAVKTGRKVTGVRLSWVRKETAAVHLAWNELRRPKGSRRARLEGKVDQPDFTPPLLSGVTMPLGANTYDESRRRFPGYDIYHVEREWREWAAAKEPPRYLDKAFLAFFATYAERHPL